MVVVVVVDEKVGENAFLSGFVILGLEGKDVGGGGSCEVVRALIVLGQLMGVGVVVGVVLVRTRDGGLLELLQMVVATESGNESELKVGQGAALVSECESGREGVGVGGVGEDGDEVDRYGCGCG